MYIKSTLAVVLLSTLTAAQTLETAAPLVTDSPDFGLTPEQTTALQSALLAFEASVTKNPTFISIASAVDAAYSTGTSDPFAQLFSDLNGDGSHLPTGTSARAAISSDIAALPTNNGYRSYVEGLETQVYQILDSVLTTSASGTAKTTTIETGSKTTSASSGKATNTSSLISSSGTAQATSTSSLSSSSGAAQATTNAGPMMDASRAALGAGGLAVLGAVLVII